MKVIIIKDKKKIIFDYILVFLISLFLFLIFYLNFLPFWINILLTIFSIVFGIIIYFFNNKFDTNKKYDIIRIIILITILFIDIFLLRTTLFLKKISASKEEIINYSILVLNNSNINTIKKLKKTTIGYYNISDNVLNDFNIKASYILYDDINKLYENLNSKKVDAIIIEDSIKLLLDENTKLNNNVHVLANLKTDLDSVLVFKEKDITCEPFNIYVSGIDIYGAINSISRSDANLIVTVNPINREILITSIPRDYYVKLHSKKGYKDKLTHASIYGIGESISTIEDLLNIKIDYYVKVNFTSVVSLVDEIGGLDVFSEYVFTSVDGYNYKKGYNTLNGEKALSFIRERYAFPNGDLTRGKNQEAFVKAFINKMINPSMLLKYNSILNKLSNKIDTNISIKDMSSLIKMQLSNNQKWEISESNLFGTGSYEYTYTYPKQKLYVMLPDEISIKNAIIKINDVRSENND